jgi:ABC-type oligopeptide transport system ATPase subunit
MYLSVKNLSKTYLKRSGFLNTKTSAIHALQDVSFELKKGKCLAIVGESGSGKSTLAKIIMKLLEPDSGSIYISKQDVLNISKQKNKSVSKKNSDDFSGSIFLVKSKIHHCPDLG